MTSYFVSDLRCSNFAFICSDSEIYLQILFFFFYSVLVWMFNTWGVHFTAAYNKIEASMNKHSSQKWWIKMGEQLSGNVAYQGFYTTPSYLWCKLQHSNEIWGASLSTKLTKKNSCLHVTRVFYFFHFWLNIKFWLNIRLWGYKSRTYFHIL